MNQHIRYHQMSIECQYMSNICQAQAKGEQDNKTNRRNKREQEKGPRGASRSKGSKALSLRVRRFKDFEYHTTSRDRRSVSNLKVQRLRKLFGGFMRSFPLQSTLLLLLTTSLISLQICSHAQVPCFVWQQ